MLSQISPKSDSGHLLNAAISLPDIFSSESFKITLKNKKEFLSIVEKGIFHLNEYRDKEGKRLKQALKAYINNILKTTKTLLQLEKKRKSKKREKLIKQIKSISDDIKYN